MKPSIPGDWLAVYRVWGLNGVEWRGGRYRRRRTAGRLDTKNADLTPEQHQYLQMYFMVHPLNLPDSNGIPLAPT